MEVKRPLLLLLVLAFALFGQREGNFGIRVEPRVVLQTGVDIPFDITVNDSLRKPVADAKVTLQISSADSRNVKVFRATSTAAGQYIAKPVFPSPGEWTVYVEVRRNDQVSSRTTQFNVPE
jgi:hypothetical protein